MKTKYCEVKLISEIKEDIYNWVEQIKLQFFDVSCSDIKRCEFDMDGGITVDFRVVVSFAAKMTKDEIDAWRIDLFDL